MKTFRPYEPMKNFNTLRDIAYTLGYTVICEQDGKLCCSKDGKKTFHWNPLIDDGDCSRLEVDLGISVHQCNTLVYAELDPEDDTIATEYFVNHTDKNAAKRTAVVRCALLWAMKEF